MQDVVSFRRHSGRPSDTMTRWRYTNIYQVSTYIDKV